ncbi:MAG: VCBS repeat-containing protein [Verrucomicrobiota bacterium]
MKKLLFLIIFALASISAFAQGTAFTYQGRLDNTGNPANASYDFTFSAWSVASGPLQIGVTLTNANTVVSNGFFTVTLDFGAGIFNGSERWLEIGVRTNGGGAFTTLSPRQLLTSTPYAVQALTAGNAATYTGAITDSQLSGNVARLNGSNVFSGVVQFNNTSNTFNGTFSGNGTSVTNVSIGNLNAPGVLSWPGNFVLVSSPVVGSGPRSVVAADVNGDGKLDLISANDGSGTLMILTNSGNGSFVAAATNAVGNLPRSVIAADVNGDGKVDLISTTSSPGTVVVLTNNGSGVFVAASTNSTGGGAGNVQMVVGADVNSDGKIDLISANGNTPGTLSVFTNSGGGGFVLVSSNLVGGNFPAALTAADVNGDGKADLISANSSSPGTISILTNNGSGGFVFAATNLVGNNPRCVTAADVNGDGPLDLIVANNTSPGTLIVLTNNGSGSFVASSTNSVGNQPLWVTAVDLNGDGKVDLISANSTSPGSLTALTNNGSGGFSLAFTSAVGNSPSAVIAADVSGDGRVDLVSANFSSGTLSVLFNLPTFTGAFAGNGGGLYNIQGGAIVSNSIPGTSIVTASIPGSAIVPGSLVTSLNNLKDDVILQAGSNTTLAATGNTLTLASTGAGIWNLNGTNTYFNAGKVGVGTNAPNHRLSIAGGPYWTSNLWRGAIDLENASAIGWQANSGGQRFGLGQSTGGLYFFRTPSDPGTTSGAATYDMELTDSGNFLIAGGSERAGVRLQVNGAAAFAPGGSGGEINIGTPNGETGLNISSTGNPRADIRFDGLSLKLLAGPAGGPPSASSGGISITTSGKVGVGTASPAGAFHVASGGLAVTGASSPYSGAGSGVFMEYGGSIGNLFAFNYSAFTPLNLVLNSPGGNVGIGAATTARLNVEGTSHDYTTPAVRAANTSGLAGQFLGRVTVSESLIVSLAFQAGSGTVFGNLTKGSGSFKIDHPLDPANKYLYHSFVESPDMMNVYNGNTNLDANGEVTIQMPEWFGSLNKDFRYQLTSIGAPGPNLYIAEEVADNHFKIAGGSAGAKVSWQVTGIRQDAWASAHRIQVEEKKPGNERGTYLHPELFGQPQDKSILKTKQ